LRRLWLPLTGGSAATEDELRIGHAQLAGWIGGLVHGIETSIAAQQAVTHHVLAPPVRRPRASVNACHHPRFAGGQ
jgi:hypothetical protein